jgi:hypothetical protein
MDFPANYNKKLQIAEKRIILTEIQALRLVNKNKKD